MKLCINCDDFGYSPEINAGIFEAVNQGLVTSCSVMAHRVKGRDLKRLNDAGVSIGLHVTLTGPGQEYPATSPLDLVSRLLLGKVTAHRIRREIEAQFNRLKEMTSVPISHLDSHQHIHLLPSIRGMLFDLAGRQAIDFVRIPWETSRSWAVKKLLLNCCFQKPQEGPGFWGTGFMGGNFTAAKILHQLDYLQQRGVAEAVWMVHVGHTTTSTPLDGYNHQRRRELAVLLHLAQELKKRCTLVPMTDLRHHSPPATETNRHAGENF